MNYLTMMSNAYMKTHNNSFLMDSSSQPTRNLLVDKKSSSSETTTTTSTPLENNNKITINNCSANDKIQKVWSKYNFQTSTSNNNSNIAEMSNTKEVPLESDETKNFKKMSWTTDLIGRPENMEIANNNNKTPENDVEEQVKVEVADEEVEASPKSAEIAEETSPSHHARRPMNAFLIFCKKHRPIVREKYPNLENRSVTRILGEWWALLEDKDKAPYTQLAKEYKDAFLSANPNFKWYKLPAPPLRTLNVRPTSAHPQNKIIPLHQNQQQHSTSPPHFSNNASTTISEFTPGKLADESQLGSLTSLMMNNNYASSNNKKIENNNNLDDEKLCDDTLMKASKPFKKRSFDKYDSTDESNMTNQDLMNKVVEKIFTDDLLYDSKDLTTRKSGRQCKGKRYEQFMVEGRLLGNKRDAKSLLTSQQKFPDNAEYDLFKFENSAKETGFDTTPNLNHTIKRLAERTNMKELLENNNHPEDDEEAEEDKVGTPEKTKTPTATSQTSDFNLNERIGQLPSLSYEVFHQRKRESKKRKHRVKNHHVDETKNKVAKIAATDPKDQLVGSKKRKNKQTITHLEKKGADLNNGDLLALATLAEVAANTEKINDDSK